MASGRFSRFIAFFLAVSSLLVPVTSFRSWRKITRKISPSSPPLATISSHPIISEPGRLTPPLYSLTNDDGSRFDGGDGNDGGDFYILNSGDINRHFDEYEGPWYPLKALFLYLSNKFNRLVMKPMKKSTKVSKLILKKRIKEEIIPTTTALVHTIQSHASNQKPLNKQVKKMSKIALKKAAKERYKEHASSMMQDRAETMVRNSFPKVPSKHYTHFNKETYVQQAMDRAKSKVLRPQDVQEYYNNLKQFANY